MSFCIFDAHADTISELLDSGEDIIKNSQHIDVDRIKCLKKSYIQVFAAFSERIDNPSLRVLKIIDKYYETLNKSEIIHCQSYDEAKSAAECGKIASFLSIEGGDALLGSIEMLRYFYRLGVRIITLILVVIKKIYRET